VQVEALTTEATLRQPTSGMSEAVHGESRSAQTSTILFLELQSAIPVKLAY
jgi:hypothetical protein